MRAERLRKLMQELMQELDRTDNVDQELKSTIKRLQADINDLVDPDTDSAENTVLDDAIALEARFAASHPVAEKILRELINNLSRIGI